MRWVRGVMPGWIGPGARMGGSRIMEEEVCKGGGWERKEESAVGVGFILSLCG